MAESGIYEIVNLVNGKRYVGSAKSFRQRWSSHRHLLRRGSHHSIALQRAWAKYGEGNFHFRKIEIVTAETLLIEREQHHLDTLKPEYNCAPNAGSLLGHKFSEATKQKVSTASKKAWEDPEIRARLEAARKVAWDDPERRAKGVKAAKKKWQDPEFREKMKSRKGPKITDQFRAAVKAGIAARIAKGLPFARQINPCRGRPLADATKEKLRQANLGKRHSAEARAKMSESRRGKKRGSRKSDQLALPLTQAERQGV